MGSESEVIGSKGVRAGATGGQGDSRREKRNGPQQEEQRGKERERVDDVCTHASFNNHVHTCIILYFQPCGFDTF